ncbi:MAG: hypothetical protein HPY85_10670 [Anaerolineae bacterium]|nr:hypothetical protein [Anaerolineae bacterium]
MSEATEHKRMLPVLKLAGKLDIASNPEPAAIYERGSGGFQIWCTLNNHPQGWEGLLMSAGAFSKPCEYVASVSWGWEGDKITHLRLCTEAYACRDRDTNKGVYTAPASYRNRPLDVFWAKEQTFALFQQAGVPMPEIRVVEQE